jgi:hypothetical protein
MQQGIPREIDPSLSRELADHEKQSRREETYPIDDNRKVAQPGINAMRGKQYQAEAATQKPCAVECDNNAEKIVRQRGVGENKGETDDNDKQN